MRRLCLSGILLIAIAFLPNGCKTRNVAPAPAPAASASARSIALTGIMTGLGKKRALLEAVLPGEPPRKTHFTLAEGEQEGGIEVLQIDEKAGLVVVRIEGKTMNLSLDKHAAH